jgi:uncharacterized membrane protein YidH (DUF202 family)
MSELFSTKIAYASLDVFLGKVSDKIINPLIILLFAVAMVYFLYGVLEFIMHQDNEEAKTTGKAHMMWGTIGLTIMICVWAIMGWIVNTFNLKGIKIQNDGRYDVELRQ